MFSAPSPRLGLIPLILTSLLLAACGGDRATPIEALLERLQSSEGPQRDAVAAELGRRAETDPDVVERLVTLLRLEEANAPVLALVFRLADPEALATNVERRRAMTKAVEVMAYRLQSYGQVRGTFDQLPDGVSVGFMLPKPRVPPGLTPEEHLLADRAYEQAVVRDLTATGSVELLLAVPPPATGQKPLSLWTGALKSYDALVEAQRVLIDAALKARSEYAPKEPGFLVSPWPSAEGEAARELVVAYRAPGQADYFDRQDFTLREITVLGTEQVGLELAVRPERQDAMRAWTASHVGRDAVLLVNGVVSMRFPLGAPIDKKTLILYGPKGDTTALTRIATILRVMGAAAHPVPILGTRLRTIEPGTPTPAAIALVACGAVGARRMNELRHEEGAMGPRAAYILEMIGRHQATGGKPTPQKGP